MNANDTETIDVIDTIAYIEMRRQLMEKEGGVETTRNDSGIACSFKSKSVCHSRAIA